MLAFTGTNNFIKNSANSGGAIFATTNISWTAIGTSDFSNNSAQYGGAIYAEANTSLSFNGDNFSHNLARFSVIYTLGNVLLTFNGTNNFVKNTADNSGGVVNARGGGLITPGNIIATFNGTNNFVDNSANKGGAIYSFTLTWHYISISNFSHNVVLNFTGINNFINNSANSDGGAICAKHNVIITFNGTNKFLTNSTGSNRGVIYARQNMIVSFIGTINHFTHSSACSGGVIYAVDNVALIFNGANNFVNNSICVLLNGNVIRESVDSLCRDGATRNICNTVSLHHKHAKSSFKHPGFLFECLCDQQDSYKWLKSTRKTAKQKSVRYQKCHFCYSFFLCSDHFLRNNDNSKTVQALTLILVRNRCSSQCAASQPFSVFIASNSPWSIKAIHNTVVAVRCEGRYFLILYACAYEVLFPGQIPRSLVLERH